MPKTAFQWPHGHRMAVIVTVLLENWSAGKAPPYGPMTTALKPGTYDRAGVTWSQYGGREGIWRLLRVINKYDLKATVCANVRSIELHPEAMRAVLASGHEVAAHSYTQDQIMAYMTCEEERETIRRCQRVFEDVLGHKPKGWLSPVVATTDHTAELLAEAGYLWHGDYNDADLPRIVRTPAGPIVALPHTDFADNRVLRQSPQTYFESYKETFDFLYREEPAALINITCHCQFGGRPLISAVFDRVLAYMRSHPDVWFPRHDEMAEWFQTLGIDEVPYAHRFFPDAV